MIYNEKNILISIPIFISQRKINISTDYKKVYTINSKVENYTLAALKRYFSIGEQGKGLAITND